MPSIFDLMPASSWPMRPFMPLPGPMHLPVWPSSSAAGWTMPPVAPPLGWGAAPPDADTSVSDWDSAMRQTLTPPDSAAPGGTTRAPGIGDSAWSDQMLADAKRAHDFVMWAFGPPSAPRAETTSTSAPSSALQYFSAAPSDGVTVSADTPPPPMQAWGADDADAQPQAAAAADRQPDLDAAPRADTFQIGTDPPILHVNYRVRAVRRGPAGRELTFPEENRLFFYDTARETLKRLDPNNRQLLSIYSPGWVPSNEDIQAINREIEAVRTRDRDLERHHNFPLQFKDKFNACGIDPEDYITYMPKSEHRLRPGGLHAGSNSWNFQWDQFYRKYPRPSFDQVQEQLNSMIKQRAKP